MVALENRERRSVKNYLTTNEEMNTKSLLVLVLIVSLIINIYLIFVYRDTYAGQTAEHWYTENLINEGYKNKVEDYKKGLVVLYTCSNDKSMWFNGNDVGGCIALLSGYLREKQIHPLFNN